MTETIGMHPRVDEKNRSGTLIRVVMLGLVVSGLIVCYYYSYPLFHSFAEGFCILIAGGVFMLTWNSRRYLDNKYLLFLGIAFLSIGFLEFVHLLSYKGIQVFQGYAPGLSTQIWVGTRYLYAFTFLLAPFILNRTLYIPFVFTGFIVLTALLLSSIFFWNLFPVCYVEGAGFTPFKILSEYIISFIFLASLGLLYKVRKWFHADVFRSLFASIVLSIASELSFTQTMTFYDSILTGHILKIISYYLIYRAIIETGLTRPFDLLFGNLTESEERLRLALLGASQGTWDVDLKTNDFLWDRRCKEILGLHPDSPQSLTIFRNLIHPEDRERVLAARKSAIREHSKFDEEYRVLLNGESVRWVRSHGRALYNQRGHPYRFMGIIQDITERKFAGAALRERENELKLIIDSAPALISYIDPDCRYRRVNKGYEVWFGTPAEQVQGSHMRDVVGEQAYKTIRPYIEQALAGEIVNFELELPLLKAGPHWVSVTYTPDRDERGRVRGFVVHVLEIGERKRAEEALRKSEERFRIAEKIGRMGHFEWNLAEDSFIVSPSLEALHGLGPGTFRGGLESWLSMVHSGDRSRIQEFIQRSFEEERKEAGFELRVVRPDGRVCWLSAQVTATYDPAHKPIRALGVMTDITEYKQMELALEAHQKELEERVVERAAELKFERDRLQTLLDSMSDEVWMCDAQGKLALVNEVVLAHAEELGLDPKDIFHPIHEITSKMELFTEDKQPLKEPLLYRALKGEIVNNMEISAVSKKTGDALYRRANANPIKGKGGETIGAVLVIRDVSDHKRMEEELQEREKQLRQTRKMESLGTLAGGIAHDFNNILNPIFINTELVLLDAPLEERMRQYLQMVLQAARRGRDLIKQIITFSRQKEQERKPTKVGPLIKEALKFLRSSLPRTIEIREKIHNETGHILADPAQIHQVFMNLGTNAAQAMKEKGGVLEVSLKEVKVEADTPTRNLELKPGSYLKLTVSDTGTGMTPEVIERAFDPFFTTKGPGEGSGMGLSVVHGIVKNHGGVITAASELGKGSTFNVFFPRMATEYTETDVPLGILQRGRERILLVDDEEAQGQSIQNMLERLGYRVVLKTESWEALSLFREDPRVFDLMITDQTMPQITGISLAEEVMGIRPDMPVVLCTGFSDAVDAERAHALGIRQFLMKPFSIGDMAETVRRALQKNG